MRRFALAAAALVVCAQTAGALRPITPPAPEFPPSLVWMNSTELSLHRLRGQRVVLVSFINLSSVNSLRVLPALRTWWQRYALDGLMIIGVHSPEYEFDKNPVHLRRALKRFGVRFPIVMDNSREVWKAYSNEGWPAHYLIDPEGRVIHDRLGEGGYREFEREIRGALKRLGGYDAPADMPLLEDPPQEDCQEATPFARVGSRRGRQMDLSGVREFQRLLIASRDGEVAYRGKWTLEPDALRSARDNPGLTDFVRVIYRGAEGLGVFTRTSRRPARVFLKQDDLWLHAGNAGADVRWDDLDRSFIVVDQPKLFYMTKNPNDSMHELFLFPAEEGAGVHGFEFSDLCQTRYDHR